MPVDRVDFDPDTISPKRFAGSGMESCAQVIQCPITSDIQARAVPVSLPR